MKGGARPGSGRKPANFDRNRARKLKQEGFSHKEIADRFGVSKWSIDWFFRKEKNESKSVGD
jgi:orotate phosphoribosyltransferase-like protein